MPESSPVRVEDHGDLRIVVVTGDLDLRTAPGFYATAATALGSRSPALVADLTACTFLDSTGISRLLRLAEAAREVDATFAVVLRPESQPGRVLKLTRCLERFAWFSSIEAAEADLSRRPRRAKGVRPLR
jgi:anti-sigma B factor antagonist